jgi:hypothetical protein
MDTNCGEIIDGGVSVQGPWGNAFSSRCSATASGWQHSVNAGRTLHPVAIGGDVNPRIFMRFRRYPAQRYVLRPAVRRQFCVSRHSLVMANLERSRPHGVRRRAMSTARLSGLRPTPAVNQDRCRRPASLNGQRLRPNIGEQAIYQHRPRQVSARQAASWRWPER